MTPLDPMSPADKPITRRMLLNRGLTMIRYSDRDEARHGWIVSETATELYLSGPKKGT